MGGFTDLAGAARSNNDTGTPDSGSGGFTFLDMGAHEFQGETTQPDSCPTDTNGDGVTDLADLLALLAEFGDACP